MHSKRFARVLRRGKHQVAEFLQDDYKRVQCSHVTLAASNFLFYILILSTKLEITSSAIKFSGIRLVEKEKMKIKFALFL